VPPRAGRGGALSPNDGFDDGVAHGVGVTDGVPLGGVSGGFGRTADGGVTGVPLGGVNAGFGRTADGGVTGVPLGGVNAGFGRTADGGVTGVPLGGVNAGFGRTADGGVTGVPLGGVNAGLGRTADGGPVRGIPRGGVPSDGGRGGVEKREGGTGPGPRPDDRASASIWANISARRSAAPDRGRRGSSGGGGFIETHHRAGDPAHRPRHQAK
jgi:hypothetical protein